MMKPQKTPLLEYDPDPNAIIDPIKIHPPCGAPRDCIICFFNKEIERLRDVNNLVKIVDISCEMGPNYIYKFEIKGKEIAIFQPGVGAALAGGNLDAAIASGCRRFIAIGSSGVLESSIPRGTLFVPTSAVRDEGTSFHYLPPSRETQPHPGAVERLKTSLLQFKVPIRECKTWTTDAFFRETPKKIKMRRAEGCLTVDMEASAFFAIAKYRGVEFAQLLYGGDDVSGEEWNARGWNKLHDLRHKMFEIATEACLQD
jgi:uridine phosphorylase